MIREKKNLHYAIINLTLSLTPLWVCSLSQAVLLSVHFYPLPSFTANTQTETDSMIPPHLPVSLAFSHSDTFHQPLFALSPFSHHLSSVSLHGMRLTDRESVLTALHSASGMSTSALPPIHHCLLRHLYALNIKPCGRGTSHTICSLGRS